MASPNTKRDKSKEYSDLYNTPEVALDKLLDFANLDKYQNILEPCNGNWNYKIPFKTKVEF